MAAVVSATVVAVEVASVEATVAAVVALATVVAEEVAVVASATVVSFLQHIDRVGSALLNIKIQVVAEVVVVAVVHPEDVEVTVAGVAAAAEVRALVPRVERR